MLRRGFLVFAGLTVSLTAVACSGKGDPPANTSSVVASSPAPSTAASTSPTVVPIDQIPPGNPAEWVPAGVPTTAKYMEPGDVVPKFTRDMFNQNQGGALDAARYYIDARNWAEATTSAAPFAVICDAEKCRHDAPYFDARAKAGLHTVGGRHVAGPPRVVVAPTSSGAQWVVQVQMRIGRMKVVDSRGAVTEEDAPLNFTENFYLKWNGTMWRVTGDFLAS